MCCLTTCLFTSTSVVQAEVPAANTLSKTEELAGWKLLFDGKSTAGWRNYKKKDINAGWEIKDGELIRAQKGAGDIISDDMYENYELMIDFKMSKGGNSGLMFLVTETDGPPWHSGPEIQLQDHINGHDPQKCGWLYQLYQPTAPKLMVFNDFKLPDPIPNVDAARPFGEWNTLYLSLKNGQGNVMLNGMQYYNFKIGSKDWEEKLAASKFAKLPNFAKAKAGHICLQDHNDVVSFRNIKIREYKDGQPSVDAVTGTSPVKVVPAFSHVDWAGWEPVNADGKIVPFRPVVITHPGDGSNSIVVGEQHGKIHILKEGTKSTKSEILLDIESKVSYSDKMNEEGLLGIAFHPDYKKNGEIFVYYTAQEPNHTSYVSRFITGKSANGSAAGYTEEVILKIPQPFWNHNGGTICFGKDGYLYISLGDGGAGNDPLGNAQNLATLFGKILRIDVNHKSDGKAYSIPADNPFTKHDGARGEIYAYGVRNPWGIAFDTETNELWMAEVGQNLWEEIDIVTAGGNYGWNPREGSHVFGSQGQDANDKMIEPVFEYDHGVGKSITGGRVYRGKKVPELQGAYLYGDYVAGRIYALKVDPKTKAFISNERIPSDNITVITFGEDAAGEVYFSMVSGDGQAIYTFESPQK